MDYIGFLVVCIKVMKIFNLLFENIQVNIIILTNVYNSSSEFVPPSPSAPIIFSKLFPFIIILPSP